jgi:hypothetical protein
VSILHTISAVCLVIGLLCVVSVSRKRKYRKLGTQDPWKARLLGTMTVFGCIALGLLINLMLHWPK